MTCIENNPKKKKKIHVYNHVEVNQVAVDCKKKQVVIQIIGKL